MTASTPAGREGDPAGRPAAPEGPDAAFFKTPFFEVFILNAVCNFEYCVFKINGCCPPLQVKWPTARPEMGDEMKKWVTK